MSTVAEHRVVADVAAARLVFGVVVRQLVTRGRFVAMVLIGAVIVVVAAAVGAAETRDDPLERGVQLVSNLGLTTLVPIVSLVFAAAALGDMREDGTLVYLWLRPMRRWPVVVGAWLASITAALPLILVPLTLAAVVLDAGSALVGATVLAATVGVIGYTALFALVGIVLRNPIVWGLGYVLVWEGIVAAFGSFAARLAIRGYTRSIVTDRTGVDLDLGDLPLAAGVAVPVAVAVVALALAAIRLQRMDVA